MTLLRSLLAWLVLLAVGFANGTLRQLTLARFLDDGPAHQLSCFTGAAALALAIAWLVRRWPLRSRAHAWATGALWLVLTVAFESSFGLARGLAWSAVLADYAVWDGRLWPLVLLSVLLTPVLLHRRACGEPLLTPRAARGLALGGVLLAAFVVFFVAVRPWYRSWGATPAEAASALPGDDVLPDARPGDTTTRAVTIAAPVEAVWPWLAQLGQDRGGFYSYEVLEDLAGCEMENADRILPGKGEWGPGDKLWMYPPTKLGGVGQAPLVRHVPGRVLVFGTRQMGTPPDRPIDGTWAFVLQPLDAGHTRLLVRGRAGGARAVWGRAYDHFFFEPVHFVMERKLLTGLRARAEGLPVSEPEDVTQVLLWVAAFALLVAGCVRVLRAPRWGRALAGVAALLVVFQVLTLRQPHPALGALLLGAAAALLWPPPALPPRAATPRPRAGGTQLAGGTP